MTGVYAQFYDKRADFNESTDFNNEKVRMLRLFR